MLTIRTNQDKYAQGETVKVTLTLCNDTVTVQEYEFPTYQQFDVFVEQKGKVIWKWSEGREFLQAFTHLTLKPGQCQMHHAEWNQIDSTGKKVKPGIYTVRGIIKGTVVEATDTGGKLEATHTIAIR